METRERDKQEGEREGGRKIEDYPIESSLIFDNECACACACVCVCVCVCVASSVGCQILAEVVVRGAGVCV